MKKRMMMMRIKKKRDWCLTEKRNLKLEATRRAEEINKMNF
jgi:hypothetical protein